MEGAFLASRSVVPGGIPADLPKIHDPVILFVHLAHITFLAKRNGSVSLGRRMASGWRLV